MLVGAKDPIQGLSYILGNFFRSQKDIVGKAQREWWDIKASEVPLGNLGCAPLKQAQGLTHSGSLSTLDHTNLQPTGP